MDDRDAGRNAALDAVWRALGGPSERRAPVLWSGYAAVRLASALPVATMAGAMVAGYALAAAELSAARSHPVPGPVRIDAGAVSTAFTSERHLRLDGEAFASFAPLSRFWPAADGYVRTHGNYPHHLTRLLSALRLTEPADPAGLVPAVGRRIAAMPAEEVAELVTTAGGLAVAVRTPSGWAAHPQGRAVAGLPLLTLTREVTATPRPLPPVPDGLPAAGIRVLDLTRVIAGPVGTRSLALLGADVLRVDSPGLPEMQAQHLDTGFGKRSTLLDLDHPGDRRVFEELLAGADVLVTGYRPAALDRYGLSPQAVWQWYPGVVVAQLSAWGPAGPWRERRGFDSLVQAASGIAAIEGGAGGQPGALGAQALDHGTGYLLAAAVLRALTMRARQGGGWLARVSLAQTAWWLVNGGLTGDGAESGDRAAPAGDTARHLAEVDAVPGRLRYALPPVTLPGGPGTWAHPPTPWGSDPPAWREPAAASG
jgi:crotonobetainyl-CoA:carnitine CoA-transferase CaiB-like acyl-CoA transferase